MSDSLAAAADVCYRPRRSARYSKIEGREGYIALTQWGPSDQPPVVLLHGWMDCAAAWQLLVDGLPDDWPLLAVDWPGYGRSAWRTDRYWFSDHFAELDWLLSEVSPQTPVRLIGHSMGGTVASMYAGIRPQRVRWAVNLEGFGMPELPHAQLPGFIAGWLDSLRAPPTARTYASLDELAVVIRRANPRLPAAHAYYLASVWAREADDQFVMRADPRQQSRTPIRYTRGEVEACWSQVTAPMLLLYGSDSIHMQKAMGTDALKRMRQLMPALRAESIADAGHLLPYEQPQRVAQAIRSFADMHAATRL